MSNTAANIHFNRRRFVKWLVGIAASTAATAAYIRIGEPRWLSVEQIEVPIANLPSAHDGKRIAQISDIHLCEYFRPERLAGVLELVERLAPDWLVLTGDFVSDDANEAAGLVEPLRSLSMPVFAVLGNHDYWSNSSTVTRFLHEAGVSLLVNASAQLGSGLWLAGVDDLWASKPDLAAALRDIPQGAPTILLAHEPDFFDRVLSENAPIALQLSGHSHGGQIRLPTFKQDPAGNYTYAPVLPQYGRRYPMGLRHIEGRYVYTNRGLGVWPVPLRLNCRPELTIVTLRAA